MNQTCLAKRDQQRVFQHAAGIGLLAAALHLPLHAAAAATGADHLFVGDHIITMESIEDAPTALAVRGDKIVWLGREEDSTPWIGPATERHELGERALLPGFIDAHGHITYLAATLSWANLASPPVGSVTDIASLQSTLRNYIEEHAVPNGAWVIGGGYDDSLISEQRHPTRDDLDAVSTSHPIALLHVSGHLMATNSLALSETGIDAETPDPAGGHIRRSADSRVPNGVLEETATYPVRNILMQPRGNPIENLQEAMRLYAGHGITTAQDGAITPPAVELLTSMNDSELLTLDVVIYPVIRGPDDTSTADLTFGSYHNRLKFGGIKLILDGSPQGKTAFLSEPYEVPPQGKGADYRGYPTHPAEDVHSMVQHFVSRAVPILAHANGDAAADMLIDAVDAATRQGEVTNHRTVMIHAQTVRDDQLDRMAALAMVPSFFSTHTFYWGDWHRDSVLGVDRASRISPTRSAINRGITFTVHNDAPIVPPDMLRLLWATTNRLTRSDQVLGPNERLTTYEALAAITRDAAYQYFEEDRKGTLAAGKLADLVILSSNPLDTPTVDLLSLEVTETWSHGVRTFTNTSSSHDRSR